MRWLAKMIVCLLFGVAAPQIVPECTLPLRGFLAFIFGGAAVALVNYGWTGKWL